MKHLLLFFLMTSYSYGASFELKPGLWKLETEVHSANEKQSVQESIKQQQEETPLTEMCVTEEESKLEASLVQEGECRFENINQTRDELSGDIACTKKRTGKARWKKVSDDEFIMTMETNSTSGPVRLTQRGYYVGKDCVKS